MAGFYLKLVKIYDVTITGAVDTGGGGLQAFCWIDDCEVNGGDQDTGVAGPSQTWAGAYCTNCTFYDNQLGPNGYILVRNTHAERIAGDVFSNSQAVIKVSCKDIAIDAPPEIHADVYQHLTAADNVVLYGIECENVDQAQAFQFNTPPVGMAIIDADMQAQDGFLLQSQYSGAFSDMYFRNVSILCIFDDPGNMTATRIVFEDCTFQNPQPGARTGVEFR